MKTSLRTKLRVLVCLPVVGLAVMTFSSMLPSLNERREIVQVLRLSSASGTLHELGRAAHAERAAIYAIAYDPASFASAQTLGTQSTEALTRALASAEFKDIEGFSERLHQAFGKLRAAHEALAAARRTILPFNASGPLWPSEQIAALRASDDYCLALSRVAEAAMFVAENPDLRARLYVNYLLSEMIDSVDRQRSLNLVGFNRGQLDAWAWMNIGAESGRRELCKDRLIAIARGAHEEEWKRFFASPVWSEAKDIVELVRPPADAAGPVPHPQALKSEWSRKTSALAQALEARFELDGKQLVEQTNAALGQVDRRLAISGSIVALFVLLAVGLGFRQISSVVERVDSAMRVLQGGASNILEASDRAASASTRLAEGSSREAAGIEETSASLEELRSMNSQNAEAAQATVEQMAQTTALVSRTAESMNALGGAIRRMTSTAAETRQIVKTIDEIAFQTNILALNAAVEAARAGEAGMGFKVVTEEVRALAKRASEASAETARRIEESSTLTEKGASLCQAVEQAFGMVEEHAKNTTQAMREIHAASQEVVRGIEQISSATHNIDLVTQQNAAVAEENAAHAATISGQAKSLSTAVDALETVVHG